jgi:hypothetical protein
MDEVFKKTVSKKHAGHMLQNSQGMIDFCIMWSLKAKAWPASEIFAYFTVVHDTKL